MNVQNWYYNEDEEHSVTDHAATLCELCVRGNIDAIKDLLECPDTNVNEIDSIGETPLHKACSTGNTEVIKLLLEQDGIEIWRESEREQTPLHVASKYGYAEAAELLLNAKSDENKARSYVNMPDCKGLTPLCYLAKSSKDIEFLQKRYFTVRLYSVLISNWRNVILFDSPGVLNWVPPSKVQQHAWSGKPKILWTSLTCVVV